MKKHLGIALAAALGVAVFAGVEAQANVAQATCWWWPYRYSDADTTVVGASSLLGQDVHYGKTTYVEPNTGKTMAANTVTKAVSGISHYEEVSATSLFGLTTTTYYSGFQNANVATDDTPTTPTAQKAHIAIQFLDADHNDQLQETVTLDGDANTAPSADEQNKLTSAMQVLTYLKQRVVSSDVPSQLTLPEAGATTTYHIYITAVPEETTHDYQPGEYVDTTRTITQTFNTLLMDQNGNQQAGPVKAYQENFKRTYHESSIAANSYYGAWTPSSTEAGTYTVPRFNGYTAWTLDDNGQYVKAPTSIALGTITAETTSTNTNIYYFLNGVDPNEQA